MSSMSLPATSSRMARIAPSTPVDRTLEAPSTTVNHDEAPLADLDLAAVISLALARSGMSHKQAAITQGVDVAQWSRQVNGQEAHVSLQRLTKLPRVFWLEFLQQLAPALDVVIAHPDLADRALHQLLMGVEAAVTFARNERALRAGGRR
jgi:hypothetical protein